MIPRRAQANTSPRRAMDHRTLDHLVFHIEPRSREYRCLDGSVTKSSGTLWKAMPGICRLIIETIMLRVFFVSSLRHDRPSLGEHLSKDPSRD